MRPLVVALALAGCTSAQLRHVNQAGLGVALAATACDWGQTDWAMAQGKYRETNMILGESPSRGAVGGYMATALVATAVAWAVLPERWRPALWGGIALVEFQSVESNMGQLVPLCGR